MYGALTAAELALLQEILYSATEKAHGLAHLVPDSDDWQAFYRPVHVEVAGLFLQAADELLGRLETSPEFTRSAEPAGRPGESLRPSPALHQDSA